MSFLLTTLLRWRSDYTAPSGRTGELFRYNLEELQSQTDRLFYYLLLLQYPAAVVLAWVTSPFTGLEDARVWIAVVCGALFTAPPVYLIRARRADWLTRQVIAAAQMLMGALLIHLSGGRIESHFHIFGSLAFLAFYRDAHLLFTATAIVMIDHALRGWLLPLSIYGVAYASYWRFVEHLFWTLFEDAFLLLACAQSRAQISAMAQQQAQLEQLNGQVEAAVRVRTKELSQRTEELAAARDAAMESTRLKSQFLANVSHEIRTPMNGVLGMTGVLLESELTSQQRECALTVQRSAESLLTIINDILDFSKIEAGKLNLEPIDFPLIDEVEDAIGLLADAAERKGLELICDLDPALPLRLHTDPGRLRQVLVNLIANAVKFTERGEVSLAVRLLPTRRLRFEVRDSGIGIPAEAGARLFASFVQVDGTMTRRYEGTGLGLAISKQLVELMGGEIGFSSVLGSGSTFWFELPYIPAAPVENAEEPDRDALAGLRVRIVVENNTSRAMLQRLLDSWGIILNEREFDLVLTDQSLPAADARYPVVRCPVVRLVPMGQRSAPLTVGKPVRRLQLFTTLARAAGRFTVGRVTTTARQGPLSHSMSVLVAEDNAVNQRVLVRMLERLGQTCDVVTDGEQAVAAARSKLYDVVLMDCQMPRLDGYEASAAIRRLPGPAGRVPIIAVTANALHSTRERCLAAGMSSHISKPLRFSALVEALSAVLPQGEPTSPSSTRR